MQAIAMRDLAAPSDHLWRDRAWRGSLGASCLLHGAALAALLLTWHIEPKSLPALHTISVTLIHTDETAIERAAQPAQATPEPPARHQKAAPAPPPPAVTAAKTPAPPAPPAKPPRV